MMIKTSKIVAAVAVIGLLTYNIIVAIFFPGATLSEQVLDASWVNLVPYGAGTLVGHWFLKNDFFLRMRARFPWLPLFQILTALSSLLLPNLTFIVAIYGAICGGAFWAMPPASDIRKLKMFAPEAMPYKLTTQEPRGRLTVVGPVEKYDNLVMIEGRKYGYSEADGSGREEAPPSPG